MHLEEELKIDEFYRSSKIKGSMAEGERVIGIHLERSIKEGVTLSSILVKSLSSSREV
jgi:hypothetical protein